MSKNLNEVHLAGRAGKDAETRYTSSGKAVTTFSLATGGGKKQGGGEWPTQWHSITAWESEYAQSIRKGQEVELFGRIEYESWDDKKTGQKKYATKIVANKFAESDSKKESFPESDRYQYESTRGQEITDDDLPPF